MKITEVEEALNRATSDELKDIATRCLELLVQEEAFEVIVEWANTEENTIELHSRLEEEL